jgi:LCP family protein required for cell wall assembly
MVPWICTIYITSVASRNEITWQGQTYRQRSDVTTILVLGSDERGTIENDSGLAGYTGQADFLCLVIIDNKNKNISLLSIPRETMVDVEEYATDGSYSQTINEQICLQYAYGTSSQVGCELTEARVSELLLGTQIDYYAACSLGAVRGVINDLGGVDITMSSDWTVLDQFYPQGSVVHMDGETAENFVHFRDTSRYYTNLERIARQKDFFNAFLPVVKEKCSANVNLPLQLLEKYKNYVTMDIPLSAVPKLAKAALNYDINWEQVITLPGEETHPDMYDCYLPDEDATAELLVSLLYK